MIDDIEKMFIDMAVGFRVGLFKKECKERGIYVDVKVKSLDYDLIKAKSDEEAKKMGLLHIEEQKQDEIVSPELEHYFENKINSEDNKQ